MKDIFVLAILDNHRNSKINRIFSKRSTWTEIKILSYGNHEAMKQLRNKLLHTWPKRSRSLRIVAYATMKKYYSEPRNKAYDYTNHMQQGMDWTVHANENLRIETWRYSSK